MNWEEADLLEDFPGSFIGTIDGMPVIHEPLVVPFIDRKDRIEHYYWWSQVAVLWLRELGRAACRRGAQVVETPAFLILHSMGSASVQPVANQLETLRDDLLVLYEGVAVDHGPGKNVVLVLPDEESYYRYTSVYGPPGESAGSGGMQIRSGYPHIVVFQSSVSGLSFGAIAHELTHLYVSHLSLPVWLEEAMAQAYEESVSPSGDWDRAELMVEHEAAWSPETIQEFWRGSGFRSVELQKVSYDLARLMLYKLESVLRPEKQDLLAFIRAASELDAGAAAAREHLGIEVGELVASVLGPGDWAPVL